MKTPKRPVALMTAAQVICGLMIPLTLSSALSIAALVPNLALMGLYGLNETSVMLQMLFALTLLRDLALGACLVYAEVEAIRIFGRVKKASAFSELNVAGLGRIVKSLTIAGLITLVLGNSLIPYLLTGLPAINPVVEQLLLPFMLLTIALMIRAVQALMRRAVEMQEETTLTI